MPRDAATRRGGGHPDAAATFGVLDTGRDAPARRRGETGGPQLHGDCARCQALCCVAWEFEASADFAESKPAGQACRNLDVRFRCRLHDTLDDAGYRGCTAYDCFGAGQRVVQETHAGQDWRGDPAVLAAMSRSFRVLEQLHELLLYLREAIAAPGARALRPRLQALAEHTQRLAASSPHELARLDVDAHRSDVNQLLLAASERARGVTGDRSRPADGGGRNLRRAQLFGADLRRADLRRADLRGAILIGADLRGADLREADVIGADLRGTDLRGADLRGVLFLTSRQLGGARGDRTTRLTPPHVAPARWG